MLNKLKSLLAKTALPTDFYVEESRMKDRQKVFYSPSGRYRIVVDVYRTTGWEYSRGRVFTPEDELVADVKRNYVTFPYAFVEGHPDGHDYLVCSADYQGQTIVRLDTGERTDYLPEAAKYGYGFCWASIHPNPDSTLLAVTGCLWAWPYEVVVYDFSDPLSEPLEIYRDRVCQEFLRWDNDGALHMHTGMIDVRRSDGTPIDELPEEEWPENDEDWEEVTGEERSWSPFTYEQAARSFISNALAWRLDREDLLDKRVHSEYVRNACRLLDRLDSKTRKQVKKDLRWSEILKLPKR